MSDLFENLPPNYARNVEGYAVYLTTQHGEGAVKEVDRLISSTEAEDDQEGFMLWLSVKRSVYEALM